MKDDPNYDLAGSFADARKAIKRVKQHANPLWMFYALRSVMKVAKAQKHLTADPVMKGMPDTVKTHELRAMGPVMLEAKRRGWIKKIMVPAPPCERRNCHASLMNVWESLVYKRGRVPGSQWKP